MRLLLPIEEAELSRAGNIRHAIFQKKAPEGELAGAGNMSCAFSQML
jgi:hypothetical protein